MLIRSLAAALAALTLAAASAPAEAGGKHRHGGWYGGHHGKHISYRHGGWRGGYHRHRHGGWYGGWSVGFGFPWYYGPRHYYPRPAYYYPAPVYHYPAPRVVYAQPAPQPATVTVTSYPSSPVLTHRTTTVAAPVVTRRVVTHQPAAAPVQAPAPANYVHIGSYDTTTPQVAPATTYVEPVQTVPATEPVYSAPSYTTYAEPAPVYTEPTPVYTEPAPVYTQPVETYTQPVTTYPTQKDIRYDDVPGTNGSVYSPIYLE